MDLYADNILDHFRHPRSKGSLVSPTAERHEVNASCGDELMIQLKIENDHITDLAWSGTGCAISQAAMSMLSEELKGMSVRDAEALTKEHVYDILGVPVGPRRFKCALLCLHALKNALLSATGKPEQPWTATVGLE